MEETQHAERNKRMKGGTESTNPQRESSLAEYDALDPEYEALIWQRDDAIEQKMPTPTIQYLEQRIANADRIRRINARQKNS